MELSTSPFKVATTHRSGGVVIAVLGDVDELTVDQFVHHATEALTDRPARLTLDLGGVTFFGSTGLTALVRIDRAAAAAGCALRLANLPPIIQRTLAITGVGKVLTVTG